MEDKYMNNRLKGDYERRERQFDSPSDSSYKHDKTKAYSESCNLKSYNDESADNECCEGFSPV